jgi:hypothetical protein
MIVEIAMIPGVPVMVKSVILDMLVSPTPKIENWMTHKNNNMIVGKPRNPGTKILPVMT